MNQENFEELLDIIDRYKAIVDKWHKLYMEEVKKNKDEGCH